MLFIINGPQVVAMCLSLRTVHSVRITSGRPSIAFKLLIQQNGSTPIPIYKWVKHFRNTSRIETRTCFHCRIHITYWYESLSGVLFYLDAYANFPQTSYAPKKLPCWATENEAVLQFYNNPEIVRRGKKLFWELGKNVDLTNLLFKKF